MGVPLGNIFTVFPSLLRFSIWLIFNKVVSTFQQVTLVFPGYVWHFDITNSNSKAGFMCSADRSHCSSIVTTLLTIGSAVRFQEIGWSVYILILSFIIIICHLISKTYCRYLIINYTISYNFVAHLHVWWWHNLGLIYTEVVLQSVTITFLDADDDCETKEFDIIICMYIMHLWWVHLCT